MIQAASPFSIPRRTIVDGVTVIWVDAPAPLTAVLSFRTGMGDEALITRGITHLIEHLVLSSLRDADVDFNGAVGLHKTTFFASGEEHEVVSFLRLLCERLADIPTEALEKETRILAEEARIRSTSTHEVLLGLRYGPNGPGLLETPEYGLWWVDADAIQERARQVFTAENAVLALTGPPPKHLSLPLERGTRIPIKLPCDDVGLRVHAPTLAGFQEAGVALGAVGKRCTGLALGATALQQRLEKRLRHEVGLTYGVSVSYDALDEHGAFLYLGTDCSPQNARRAGTEFVQILNDVSENGVSQDEIDGLNRTEARKVCDPAALVRWELMRAAEAEVEGREYLSSKDVERLLHATTPEMTRSAVADAWSGALLIADEEVEGLAQLTRDNDPPLAGTAFRPRTRRLGVDRLVVGGVGFAARRGDSWLTVPWDNLAMAMRPTESARVVMDRNGRQFIFDSQQWKRSGQLLRAFDAAAPSDRVLVPIRTPGQECTASDESKTMETAETGGNRLKALCRRLLGKKLSS